MTPEAKTKQKIKQLLDKYRDRPIYTYMPVPGGYGAPTLDYLGFFYGEGFAIEAKRPGGKPAVRQLGTIDAIRRSGAKVFVVSDDASLAELDYWLDYVAWKNTTHKQLLEESDLPGARRLRQVRAG
jgi:hypothetical protein